jgi:membrane protease YdiL (CAAX protease family)
MIPAVTVVGDDYQILLIIPAAFGPFISALITLRVFDGKESLRKWLRSVFRFKIPIHLYLSGAFFIPLTIGVLQYALYRILGGTPAFAEAEPWFVYLAYLIPTALLTGGNEEPGWRGFALPLLNKLTTPLLAGLILGIIHSLWHLPLMDRYGTNILWYAFNLIPLTFLFNWFYLKSQGSIWPVMLFHAGTNVIYRFIPTPINVLEPWGDLMVLRGLVYWLMVIVLIIATRGKLGWNPRQDETKNELGMEQVLETI